MSIYKEFNIVSAASPESGDVVSNAKDIVSSGMFEGGKASITTFFTSSTQSASSAAHYLDIFSSNPVTDTTAKSQFSIAYGHFNGSGSVGKQGVAGNRASAAIYRQLSNTLLGPNKSLFTFAGSGTNIKPKYIYAISMARQQLREKMDPGNWELHLSGSATGNTSGSQGKIKLIDDSGATTNPEVNQGGRVFNVVSGSIQSGTAVTKFTAAQQPGGALGLFYPDLGIIILNGPIVNASASLQTGLASNTEGGNNVKFLRAITGSAHTGFTGYFAARREEVITSQHYFCRIPNKEFNFSSNPTFATASDGSLTQATFFKNPKTFITQVGLYNDDGELLAIAKLSKPLLKSYSREAIIKVKLDF
tara:strand:+ start:7595 stop:8680 length:1086 start_codon:yes stop_codon:yes gene_type:complete